MANEQTNIQVNEKKGFTNQEIQSIEADRQDPSSWNVIRLLRDGNYWHANEWSGWLMAVVIPDEMKRRYPEQERLVITPVRKFAKNLGADYVFVGCQEKSFDKFIPKEIQVNWTPIGNLRIDVAIELPAEIGEVSYERLLEMYLNWKGSVPLSKEKGEKNGRSSADNDGRRGGAGGVSPGIMDTIRKILSYPLSQRTPCQAHDFVGEVQQELLQHF